MPILAGNLPHKGPGGPMGPHGAPWAPLGPHGAHGAPGALGAPRGAAGQPLRADSEAPWARGPLVPWGRVPGQAL